MKQRKKRDIPRLYASMIQGQFAENVVRLLSLVPKLSHNDAAQLLRRHRGSVRRATRDARRILAATDPTICVPVPEDPDFRYSNLGHATNSCYIAATIAACFASWDAWDALLTPPPGAALSKRETLRGTLRSIVNQVRQGKAVSYKDVEAFRTVMVQLGFPGGKRQEDATDLFTTLVEHLGAPLLPLGENLVHDATREDSDERLVVERLLWLAFEQTSGEVPFESLLEMYFFGEQRTGIRRRMSNKQAIVDAWCVRLLLPEYAPSQGGDTLRRNSFDTLSMPFAIKRYTGTMEKNRTKVTLPTTLDVTRYISDPDGGRYSLRLKSVVCHLGTRLGYGHYVAYTYDITVGWRRWDDMKNGLVERDDEADDGLPSRESWRDELTRDTYMVFYELLPGDGRSHPNTVLEASASGELDLSMLSGEMGQLIEFVMNTDNDEVLARFVQDRYDAEYAQSEANRIMARNAQLEADAETADELTRSGSDNSDENLARNLQEKDDAAYAKSQNKRALSRRRHKDSDASR